MHIAKLHLDCSSLLIRLFFFSVLNVFIKHLGFYAESRFSLLTQKPSLRKRVYKGRFVVCRN